MFSNACTDCKRIRHGIAKLLSAMEDIKRRLGDLEKAVQHNKTAECQFTCKLGCLEQLKEVQASLVNDPARRMSLVSVP